jgi:AhpC/TSA family
MLVLLLALPAAWGDDPKDKEKKDASPKEQYAALVKEFSTKQQALLTEARKAKGEEQDKLFDKYLNVGKDFADKFLKLADDNPKDAVASDAYFWIVQNGAGSGAYKKASDKVMTLLDEMSVKDLLAKLNRMQGSPAIFDAVLKRAEKDAKDPEAGDLVAWVAMRSLRMPNGLKAVDLLLEKYPEHKSVEQVVAMLGRMGIANADEKLKKILETSKQPKVQAAAAMGLGKILAEKCDGLGDKPAEADKVAAEAEKYLTQAINLYGNSNEAQRKGAEGELHALKTLRVGKEAPEIKAGDLDGKDFKLSDYRGKVVLLDFWGNW